MGAGGGGGTAEGRGGGRGLECNVYTLYIFTVLYYVLMTSDFLTLN